MAESLTQKNLRQVREQLANSPDVDQRLAVAQDPYTPASMLKRLAHDRVGRVRFAVLQNPRAGLRALRVLQDDDIPEIRSAARVLLAEKESK